jgi:flagellar motility protein MotE (MotC chaperone)
MSRLPRILPLTAIAVGGVLGVKVLADAQAVPQALAGAKAWAEEAAAKVSPASKPDAKASAGKAAADASGRTTTLPPSATPGPVTVCAPSAAELAKSAGLSPAELQVLQSLGTRRGQLDKREQDIDTQMALLAAAEAKVDAKIKSMNGLKAEMQALLGQADKKQDEETLRLVSVYEKMKPKDAASLMAALDDKVRIPVAAKMKDKALAAVLSAMPTAEAKHITESLAQRYAAVQAAAAAMNAPPAPAAADPKASAAKAGLDPAAAEKASQPAAKPKAVARAKPRRAKPKAVAKADSSQPAGSGREYPKPTAAPPAATPPAMPPAASPQG